MSEPVQHPSYLALDRHCLAAVDDSAVTDHLRTCTRCRDYVERHVPFHDEPAWLKVEAARIASPSPAHHGRVRAWLFASAAALAAVCLLLIWPRQPPSEPYVGAKGGPSALVHVQRAGIANVWNGEPLLAGDKIRLEVMPDEFGYVSVFSWPARKPPVLLYAGRVRPRGASLLPKAWELDAAPGPEPIVLLFAHAMISPAAAEQLLHAHDPSEVAVVRVNLPKRSPR